MSGLSSQDIPNLDGNVTSHSIASAEKSPPGAKEVATPSLDFLREVILMGDEHPDLIATLKKKGCRRAPKCKPQNCSRCGDARSRFIDKAVFDTKQELNIRDPTGRLWDEIQVLINEAGQE